SFTNNSSTFAEINALTTFNSLVSRLKIHPAFSSDASNAIPVWKQIAIGSVCHFIDRFLEALLNLERDRIKWPQGTQLATVIHGFEYGETGLENQKLPNVIGAMDGTYIPIYRPSKNGIRFINCKNFYSINLLGVWVPGGTYIITDTAYPISTYLMKAFSDYETLTHRERHFNKVLSLIRMIIEQAFGILKGCWRILSKEIYCTDLERIIKIIHACCILHNLCIDREDILSLEEIEIEESQDNNNNNELEESFILNERRERNAGI
ncbi:1594_t:CDS:2, partial [Scutellospora calospora]